MRPTPRSNHFILEAFDRDLWCPVLQALVHVPDLDVLRAILGDAADNDPDLRDAHLLDPQQLATLVTRFAVAFDPGQLDAGNIDISVYQWRRPFGAPYLAHSGYELPLLLDGRKKLACMSHG